MSNVSQSIPSITPKSMMAVPMMSSSMTSSCVVPMKIKEEVDDDHGAGITVNEYLINNYPPITSFSSEASASMVAYSDSAYLSRPSMVKEDYEDDDDAMSNSSNTNTATDKLHLTIEEDAELRKIRRRMKNKISAQESRRRKKEYVDMLEQRLKQKDSEKDLLQRRVTQLEEKVRLLVDQLFIHKRLQQFPPNTNVPNGQSSWNMKQTKLPMVLSQMSRATQTGTCLSCFRNNMPRSSVGKPPALHVENTLLNKATHAVTSTRLDAQETTQHPTPPVLKNQVPFYSESSSINFENLTNVSKSPSSFQQRLSKELSERRKFQENHESGRVPLIEERISAVETSMDDIDIDHTEGKIADENEIDLERTPCFSSFLETDPSLFEQLSSADHATSPSHT